MSRGLQIGDVVRAASDGEPALVVAPCPTCSATMLSDGRAGLVCDRCATPEELARRYGLTVPVAP